MNLRLLCALLTFMVLFNPFGLESQQSKVLHYKEKIRQIVVPFRVFHNGEIVKDLTAGDFKLIVNEETVPITHFFKEAKTIRIKGDKLDLKHLRKQRLFVLIFNLSDYLIKIEKELDFFFDNILKRGDRVIFMSNSFFLNNHVVTRVKDEKKKILQMLKFEKIKLRSKLISSRNLVASLLKDMHGMIMQLIKTPVVMRFFITGYTNYLKNYRRIFLNLDSDQYLALTEYLKSQTHTDRWILSFYQVAGYYHLGRELERFVSNDVQYEELRREQQITDKLPVVDLSKYFINSGATVHTILMKNSSFNDIDLRNGDQVIKDPRGLGATVYIRNFDMQYKPIMTSAEDYLKRSTQLSGGELFSSKRTRKFFQKIIDRHDILYTLTYTSQGENERLRIVPVNKAYKVVYDDQKRGYYFGKLLKSRQAQRPSIFIDGLKFSGGVLSFTISDYALKSDKGKVELSLEIVNAESNKSSKRKKVILPKGDRFPMKIRLPRFKGGAFYTVIEAKDLMTGANDIRIQDLK